MFVCFLSCVCFISFLEKLKFQYGKKVAGKGNKENEIMTEMIVMAINMMITIVVTVIKVMMAIRQRQMVVAATAKVMTIAKLMKIMMALRTRSHQPSGNQIIIIFVLHFLGKLMIC